MSTKKIDPKPEGITAAEYLATLPEPPHRNAIRERARLAGDLRSVEDRVGSLSLPVASWEKLIAHIARFGSEDWLDLRARKLAALDNVI